MEINYKRRRVNMSTSVQPGLTQMYSNPFAIFPEELWLIIIGHCSQHQTLQNLTAALPEFGNIFKRQFSLLQFVQVSPRVFEYQPSERHPRIPCIVNKEWFLSASGFLKQNPLEKSFHFSEGKNVKRIVPQSNFQFCLPTNQPDMLPRQVLSKPKELLQFYQELKQSANKNPVLPALNIQHHCFHQTTQFFEVCTQLFSEFGSAMQNVTLDFKKDVPCQFNAKQFFVGVLNLVKYLPNVRTLALGFLGIDTIKFDKITEYPPLSRLQNLEIRATKDRQYFILKYFCEGGYFTRGTIKSLKFWYVEPRYESIEEYHLNTKLSCVTVPDLDYYLKQTKTASICIRNPQSANISAIFRSISKNHKAVENLTIDIPRSGSLFVHSQQLSVLSSVRYLKVSDHSLTGFEFLKALPSLEHLQVQCRPQTKAWFLNTATNDSDNLSWLLRNYLYHDNVPKQLSIWKELPTLKTLTVEIEGIYATHFVREYKNKAVIFKNSIEFVDLEE